MNLIKCTKGHYYDGDRYPSCPHCGAQTPSSDSVTISLPSGGSTDVTVALGSGSLGGGGADGESVTIAQYPSGSSGMSSDPVTQKGPGTVPPEVIPSMQTPDPAVPMAPVAPVTMPSLDAVVGQAQGIDAAPSDDSVTVSYYSQKISTPVLREPVVGWLVCTSGKYFGQSFQLKSGRNFIGRSPQMDVCLEGENSVSRERHAIILYEPRERMFIAQAGDSRELFYINDEVVLDNTVLKPYDVISVGKVDMRIIPCCTKEFAWEDLEEGQAGPEEKKPSGK